MSATNYSKEIQKAYQITEQEYGARTKKSKELHLQTQSCFPGGVPKNSVYFKPYPLALNNGKGAYVYDLDGNEYIDYMGGYSSMVLGNAHPAVVKAVSQVISQGTLLSAAQELPFEHAMLLCKRMKAVDQVRYCNSGTEATLAAIKAARAYTGKPAIVKMEGAYHGYHDFLEYNLSGPYENHPGDGIMPYTSALGVSRSTAQDLYVSQLNDIEGLEAILAKHGHRIAAVLIDPSMGNARIVPATQKFMEAARDLTKKYNTLLIFDEVMSFRTRVGGAQEAFGVYPDLTCLAKLIGGGFPVGAIVGRKEVMSVFDVTAKNKVNQSGTFSANTVTIAAGIATLKEFDHKAVDYLETLSVTMEKGMSATLNKYKFPASVIRIGSMISTHFTEKPPLNYVEACHNRDEFVNLFFLTMLNKGVFSAHETSWYLNTAMTPADIEKTLAAYDQTIEWFASMV